MERIAFLLIPLTVGYLLDKIFGDPPNMPHLIVGFGKVIAFGEQKLNRDGLRLFKGALMSIGLVAATFSLTTLVLTYVYRQNMWVAICLATPFVFYCLAGTTLINEVRKVFCAVNRSLEEGRLQVARIVGRNTSNLSEQEIKTAALETLAENLSDGVIAPLFWYTLLGVPGMMTYKMINTLDSMIGYRNERYLLFGRIAACMDDLANLIPARLTALLMILAAGKPILIPFIAKFGHLHLSPNSGYPEAALAGILDCRFGGTHDYFGQPVEKPYIGTNARELTHNDMQQAVRIAKISEWMAVGLASLTLATKCCL